MRVTLQVGSWLHPCGQYGLRIETRECRICGKCDGSCRYRGGSQYRLLCYWRSVCHDANNRTRSRQDPRETSRRSVSTGSFELLSPDPPTMPPTNIRRNPRGSFWIGRQFSRTTALTLGSAQISSNTAVAADSAHISIYTANSVLDTRSSKFALLPRRLICCCVVCNRHGKRDKLRKQAPNLLLS